MEVGPWFVQGVPILAKPAPVPGVQIVERGRKVDEEEERERKWKREGTRPALPWPHPHSKREREKFVFVRFSLKELQRDLTIF